MEGSWWKERNELDENQQSFVSLPLDGKYLLLGPPGSGKTNLLLLRAKYLHASGMKNGLFLTLTRSLTDFIQTGVADKRYVDPDQVMTFRKWARDHISTHARTLLKDYPSNALSYEQSRGPLLKLLQRTNESLPTASLYDFILIDEVQDLLKEELDVLIALSPRLAVAGDNRQAIYNGDALTSLVLDTFEKTVLKYHYRLGHKICELADRLLPPRSPELSLSKYCQYDETRFASSCRLHSASTRKEQFDEMLRSIRTQLLAYPGEFIGILVPDSTVLESLKELFLKSEFADHVAYHDLTEYEHSFTYGKRLHLLTIHSAKGVEFRAVHLFGVENVKFPLNRREIMFTAATRAKTSLSVYYSGKILHYIESAFASPTVPTLDELF